MGRFRSSRRRWWRWILESLADHVRLELSRFGPPSGLGEVLARWPGCVGAAIARNAWPSRIARDGTLHVSTVDSVWAFELGHRAGEIAARLGVPRVRFSPGPVPGPPPDRPTPSAPRPTAEHEAKAASLAAAIEDERLRQSVQTAALFGLARNAADPPL